MLESLAEAFRHHPEVRWTRPAGGLYVWLKFPPHMRTGYGSAFLEAAMREAVLYIPGEFCHVDSEDVPLAMCEARLCYGVATIEQIREGVARFGRAARGLLKREPELAVR
jgi:2-aminoadipate transaminase